MIQKLGVLLFIASFAATAGEPDAREAIAMAKLSRFGVTLSQVTGKRVLSVKEGDSALVGLLLNVTKEAYGIDDNEMYRIKGDAYVQSLPENLFHGEISGLSKNFKLKGTFDYILADNVFDGRQSAETMRDGFVEAVGALSDNGRALFYFSNPAVVANEQGYLQTEMQDALKATLGNFAPTKVGYSFFPITTSNRGAHKPKGAAKSADDGMPAHKPDAMIVMLRKDPLPKRVKN